MRKRLIDLKLGTFISGWLRSCQVCREWFIGRKDAVYCSKACAEAARRAKGA